MRRKRSRSSAFSALRSSTGSGSSAGTSHGFLVAASRREDTSTSPAFSAYSALLASGPFFLVSSVMTFSSAYSSTRARYRGSGAKNQGSVGRHAALLRIARQAGKQLSRIIHHRDDPGIVEPRRADHADRADKPDYPGAEGRHDVERRSGGERRCRTV